MDPHYVLHGRTERLVAAGRVVLASSSLLAIWLDPSQPEKYEAVTYGLMAAYVACTPSWSRRSCGARTSRACCIRSPRTR